MPCDRKYSNLRVQELYEVLLEMERDMNQITQDRPSLRLNGLIGRVKSEIEEALERLDLLVTDGGGMLGEVDSG